ncbi:hypothetical protein [Kordiimonas laminariae]|uniref:hypothetical protein n=1 Tax=Kordiimonas laminariae TaxID=2917717 RepID=UPI001FF30F64|nr:hypothetical protein [Kordiimonas laminariae]MCK0068235.1 hypothetical protein [Kordiimonas laminariae]
MKSFKGHFNLSLTLLILGIIVLILTYISQENSKEEAKKERDEVIEKLDQANIETGKISKKLEAANLEIKSLREENKELFNDNQKLITLKTGELKGITDRFYNLYIRKNTPKVSISGLTINDTQDALIFQITNTGKYELSNVKFLYRNSIRYFQNNKIIKEIEKTPNGRVYIKTQAGEALKLTENLTVNLPFQHEIFPLPKGCDRVEIETMYNIRNQDFFTADTKVTLVYLPYKKHWNTDTSEHNAVPRFGISP